MASAIALEPRQQTVISRAKHLLPLDGLRGFAILLVFAFHYYRGIGLGSSWVARAAVRVLNLGWSGVDLFFVLSGFLITGILYDSQHKPGYYRNFYARRALRIFPIYYLAAAICVLLLPFSVWQRGHLWFLIYLGFPATLMFPSLLRIPVLIDHIWSLSLEEQFYFLWPWLTRKLRTKANLLKLYGVMIILALLLRILLVHHHKGWARDFIFCRMDALAMGAALALLFRSKRVIPAWTMFLSGSVAFILLCFVRRAVNPGDPWLCTLGLTLLLLIYGGLLMLSLGPLASVFSTRILRFFGRYSYGLYLYHFLILNLLLRVKPRVDSMTGGLWIYPIACLGINVAIAMLSFHMIEQPILRWKTRFV